MKEKYRLKKDADFKRVLNKKIKISCKNFLVYYAKNDIEHVRIGISTSKKLGNAVVRNRIRRQIRAMVNEIIDLESPYDLVVVVRNDYLQDDFRANSAKFFTLLKGIGGLNVKQIKKTA